MNKKLEITEMSVIDEATHDEIKQLEKDTVTAFVKGLILGGLMTGSFIGIVWIIFNW